jgi:hypothetical protein
MPDFEDDDLALFARERGQGMHGGLFLRFADGGGFEPSFGFQFAGQASPHIAAVVEGPVTKAAEAIMFRLVGCPGSAEEGDESLLKDILGLVMAQSEGAAVEEEERGFGVIEILTPVVVRSSLAHFAAFIYSGC